jgi:hypothetical protein
MSLRLTDADRAAWATYEAANARAAEQYKTLPIAHNFASVSHACDRCAEPTKALGRFCGPCRSARRAEREAS